MNAFGAQRWFNMSLQILCAQKDPRQKYFFFWLFYIAQCWEQAHFIFIYFFADWIWIHEPSYMRRVLYQLSVRHPGNMHTIMKKKMGSTSFSQNRALHACEQLFEDTPFIPNHATQQQVSFESFVVSFSSDTLCCCWNAYRPQHTKRYKANDLLKNIICTLFLNPSKKPLSFS